MSATDTHEIDASDVVPGPKRFRPNQIAILIGVVIAAVVALSGVAATVFQFHDDSAIQRQVFDDIPGRSSWSSTPSSRSILVYGAVLFSQRVQELGARRARPPAHHAEERQAPPRATSAPASTCRRCCATPPPGSCTR